MRPMIDDADDGDITTLSSQFDKTSAATAERLLREALQIRFDDLEWFEEASRPDTKPWFIREQLEPVP